ncbi:hypothetical protein QJS04_geneDACA015772 [Acorus gramineus]|uniref:Uncharacterized protein n=1 Tax=Acorus gramineus TaxID=55184 RepID=A0AAV9BMP0_ACOGR|nr:hypothetical protein QJS04_geneDACA015772 [Acorus gramineus]
MDAGSEGGGDSGEKRMAVAAEEDERNYKTPTSKKNKIPRVVMCPPAPKKRRAAVDFDQWRRVPGFISPNLDPVFAAEKPFCAGSDASLDVCPEQPSTTAAAAALFHPVR